MTDRYDDLPLGALSLSPSIPAMRAQASRIAHLLDPPEPDARPA